MARSAAALQPDSPPEPQLRLVPRRRGAMGIVGAVITVLFAALLGITIFQTRLAERQLQLDRLERQVSASRDRYDQLRQHRAQLRAPERLAAEAMQLGMVPGAAVEFVEVPSEVVAIVAAAGGGLDPQAARPSSASLDDYRQVKSVVGVTP